MDEHLSELLKEVPAALSDRSQELIRLTDAFCEKHLDDDYKLLCREMTACVCQEGSPACRGKPAGWAAGIVYSLGWVNFLSDPSQSPHMTTKEIAEGFCVGVSTIAVKTKVIKEGLGLMPFHPAWTLPSLVDDNPMIWMFEVDGLIRDLRDAPREVQVAAFENGRIPYVPADRPPELRLHNA